jgi:hypothetical protein
VNRLLVILGNFLLFFCLVDPLDKIFGLKLISLSLFFILFSLNKIFSVSSEFLISKILIYFVICFSILIPASSILMHPNEFDFQYYKPYFFLFIAIPFYNINYDFAKPFVRILDILCVANVLLFIYIVLFPDTIMLIYDFGGRYSIFSMPTKNYGSFSYIALYFQISPLFIVSFCFNLSNFIINKTKLSLILLLINFLALLICGSRNNIIGAFFAPIILFFVFYNKLSIKILTSVLFLFIFSYYAPDLIEILSKPDSDTTKINFINEYLNLLSDPLIFLTGQGIGSDFFTSSRGASSNTELTYFEIIRRLGFIFGVLQIFLMFLPLFFLKFLKTSNHWIFLSYFLYLIMSISNPFYFNSSGMLLLSFVLIEIVKSKKHKIKSTKSLINL